MLSVDRVDLDHDLLVIVGEGVVGFLEFTSLWYDLGEAPVLPELNGQLYDLRGCLVLLDPREIEWILEEERVQGHLLRGKHVAIVSDMVVTYGTARRLQLRGGRARNYEVEVFGSIEEAHTWLGVARGTTSGVLPQCGERRAERAKLA